MCGGCYREYGSPAILTDNTYKLVGAISEVYRLCGPTGGKAHVVIDDWNLEDDIIQEVIDREELDETESYLMNAMLAASEDERATALAIYNGFDIGVGERM